MNYEEQYMDILKNIIENGYYANNRTGIPTYKLPHQIIQVNLEKEFPILKSKKVAFKTAVKEMLWIYQQQSNVVENLRKRNVKIWNEWEGEDGTIGKAYGYQIRKFHQIDNLIDALKNNPQDRRMMLNLWNWADLPEMNLAPCCFLTMWDVTDGHLNCMLVQRSGDMGLGVPFNTTQFAVLTCMLAQVTGLKPGLLTHVINNAHVYENQLEGVKTQIKRYIVLKEEAFKIVTDELIRKKGGESVLTDADKPYIDIISAQPKLWLNPEIKNFYDFQPDDIKIEDYKHLEAIKMPVAV